MSNIHTKTYKILKTLAPSIFGSPVVHGVENLVNNKPTIFLTNQNIRYNAGWIHLALYNKTKFRTTSIVKKKPFKELNRFKRWIGTKFLKATYCEFIDRKEEKDKEKQLEHLLKYAKILKNNNLLISVTGRTSLTGYVDYHTEDIPLFAKEYINFINQKINGEFNIQYVYTTYDYLFNQAHVVFDKPFSLDNPKAFIDGMRESAIITGMQILDYADRSDDPNSISQNIERCRQRGFTVVPTDKSGFDIEDKIIEFFNKNGPLKHTLHSGSRKKQIGAPIYVASREYAANQIRHLEGIIYG